MGKEIKSRQKPLMASKIHIGRANGFGHINHVPPAKNWQCGKRRVVSEGVSISQKLRVPIGAWISESHQKCLWFFSPSENAVYRKLRVGWKRYDKTERQRTVMDRLCFQRSRRVFQTPHGFMQNRSPDGPKC